LAGRDAEGG